MHMFCAAISSGVTGRAGWVAVQMSCVGVLYCAYSHQVRLHSQHRGSPRAWSQSSGPAGLTRSLKIVPSKPVFSTVAPIVCQKCSLNPLEKKKTSKNERTTTHKFAVRDWIHFFCVIKLSVPFCFVLVSDGLHSCRLELQEGVYIYHYTLLMLLYSSPKIKRP